MDNQVKSVSWIGNICEKFETFYAEIDGVIKQDLQYAEHQLLTAGENVKQFCSGIMEEVLPASIINSLQEKTPPSENERSIDHTGGVLDEETDTGHTNGPSDCNSTPSITMETVEEADITLSFTLKSDDGREMSFEENRVKETIFPEILKFEGNNNGEFHGLDNMPNTLQVDSQSSYSPEAGETSDINPQDGEAKLSIAQHLANSIVSAGSNDCQLPENEVSYSGHALSKEFIHEELNGHKADETKDKYVTKLDVTLTQLPNKVKIEESSVLVDSNDRCLASDCPEQPPIYQRTACKSCLTMKSKKECECEEAAGSKDFDAESNKPDGKFQSQALLTAESESVDEEFCESDWVII